MYNFSAKLQSMTAKLEEIKNKALPVLREAGITRSAIFGSYVRGEERPGSDIDILVELPKGTGLFGLSNLQHKLETVLKKKVDLATYNSLHPLLRDRILKEQLPLL